MTSFNIVTLSGLDATLPTTDNTGVSTSNVQYDTEPNRAKLLSGIDINQNVQPAASNNFIIPSGNYYYQHFQLPDTYARGGDEWPDMTGVQFCISSPNPPNVYPNSVQFNYILLASGIQTTISGTTTSGSPGWQLLASGTSVGIQAQGAQVWGDVYFDPTIPITPPLENATFSIGLMSLNGWYYSTPNPYPLGAAYQSDNRTPLSPASSFMFRLLTYSADAGTDFLGNSYRNMVFNHSADEIQTFQSTDPNSYWLSKPNPSKFAVEALYFDITDANGDPQTIDRILLDPITQGPFFHIYYSDEGNPESTTDAWEAKLWIPVAQTYRLTKRDIFALPVPITAKYICIEFTRLQSQYYSAGTYQQPVIYKKYPQWIYDYYVNSNNLSGDPFIASTINVIYNRLKFAFDYYLSDLNSQPTDPNALLQPTSIPVAPNTDGQINPTTLNNINTNLNPFARPPGTSVTGKSALSSFVRNSVNNLNYPVESLDVPVAVNASIVSVPDRSAIIQQEQMPDLYFFINSRHFYQNTQAEFEYNRAYFVGIRQAVFLREDYTVPYDTPLYIESGGDNQNAYRNDFTSINNTFQVINTDAN